MIHACVLLVMCREAMEDALYDDTDGGIGKCDSACQCHNKAVSSGEEEEGGGR